jgi:hypothetical protein
MAIVLTDAFISIDGTEVSGKNTNVAISMSASAEDVTVMGDETRVHVGGIKDWSMSFEFVADEAVTGDFFDMVGTVVPVEVRASTAARSTSNPAYVGDALVTEYEPLSGNVGAAHKVSLTVVSHGPLQRLTTAS